MKQKIKNWLSLVTVMILTSIMLNSCYKTPDYERLQEEAIANYIENSDKDFVKQESGLYYAEVLTGEGNSPSNMDTVSIYFSSYLLGGTLMNSNILYDPADYVIGDGVLTPGIEEALTYMKPGGKSYALVPSYLGYGNYSAFYDPFTPLLFYLELVDVGYFND